MVGAKDAFVRFGWLETAGGLSSKSYAQAEVGDRYPGKYVALSALHTSDFALFTRAAAQGFSLHLEIDQDAADHLAAFPAVNNEDLPKLAKCIREVAAAGLGN
jgi:hypothetical protein